MTAKSEPINLSIFELLKAGPGPSSSHTIGPMKAGADFAALAAALPGETLKRAQGLRVRLLGSLSATGEGHGTDRAVLAGLMGHEPESCPPGLLNELGDLPPQTGGDSSVAAESSPGGPADLKRALKLPGKLLPLSLDNISFGPIQHNHPYSNTLIIDLLDKPYPTTKQILRLPPMTEEAAGPDQWADHIILSRVYYSVGGGFIQWEGWEAPARGRLPHPYANTKELMARLAESGLSLEQLMLENEIALTGLTEAEIERKLDALLEIMRQAVKRGCETSGRLPGAIGLARKAQALHVRAESMRDFDHHLARLNAFAYAAAEENAAGNTIVTAPTCGSAGVIPAIVVFMEEHLRISVADIKKGLLAAVAMGFIAKWNAGIAGAEVGCQGEIGVASAMAAAMLAYARGCQPKVAENAAEIALEHHLGLTCDPVGGYVQIPCIERNAMGAVKAYNAALIAATEDPANHKVSYDETLKAMAETGRDMNHKYKETSTGGLAVCLAEC
ncbi:L-serine ammonia-lyase, iron-sulfur-dependent, subunit alpha [Deltaproteobacteria bacterium OttesenSCG-928-K17]|nr:L-serine ammonia-lyase, iron-sulfur-dependent, subunit alpha [Deltaproteobacteria bacterium OttesenSCG-928-K17]